MADINNWNERIIAEFRANEGHVGWSDDHELAAGRPVPPLLAGYDQADGAPIILLHSIGARTGHERVNPMMYRPVGTDFAVFATYGGSPRHPGWYHNLVAHPRATVEVDVERVPVTARVTEGAERQRIWSRQVESIPVFAEFEAAAARQIPVLLLERLS